MENAMEQNTAAENALEENQAAEKAMKQYCVELAAAVEFWRAFLEKEELSYFPYRYKYHTQHLGIPFLSCIRDELALQKAHGKFDNILTKKMEQLGSSRSDAILFVEFEVLLQKPEAKLPKPKSSKPICPIESFDFFAPYKSNRDFRVTDEKSKREYYDRICEGVYDLTDEFTSSTYKSDMEKKSRKLCWRRFFTFIPHIFQYLLGFGRKRESPTLLCNYCEAKRSADLYGRRAIEQNPAAVAAAAADDELVAAVEFWNAVLEQEDEPFYPYRYRYRDRPFLSPRSQRDLQVVHAKFDNILEKKMQQLGCSRPDAIAFIESTLPKPKSYKPIYPAESFNFFPPNRYRDFDVTDEMITSRHERALESIYNLFDDFTTNVEIMYKADIENEARKLRSLRLRRVYYTFIPCMLLLLCLCLMYYF